MEAENGETIKVVEVQEVKEKPWIEIEEKENITGASPNGITWGLPDQWLEKIEKMNSDFIYIKEVGNHIEIGAANVNCIE